MKWLIIGGSVAAVVLVAALVIPRTGSGGHGNAPTQAQPQNETPSQSPGAVAPATPSTPTPANSAAVPDKSRAPKTTSKSVKPQKAESKTEGVTEPPP